MNSIHLRPNLTPKPDKQTDIKISNNSKHNLAQPAKLIKAHSAIMMDASHATICVEKHRRLYLMDRCEPRKMKATYQFAMC